MYPLSHHGQTLAAAAARSPRPGITMPGADGELRQSWDRHRTPSYRLSCISEHQKENTRASDDECFPSSAQALKTPSLEPVRWLHRHRQANGKSQSSGDGSTVSPFQLDPEPIEGVRDQETNHHHHGHFVFSTWRCEQIEPREALDTKPPGLAAPGTFEVQWHIIRWTDAQPRNIYINGHGGTISGTGFDGPRSSTGGTSPIHSPNDVSSAPSGSLSLGNCIPCRSRGLRSDTPASIDWEKNWLKRKPRKRHDVSESSDLGTPTHKRSVDSPSIETGDDNTGLLKREEQEDQSQFRNTQECALKSCPEFYRRSFSAARNSISKFAPETISELKSPNYTRFDSSRHQHRHRIQDTVSKRFHSLRDRLRRGRSSSMFSVRPEFPPPPTGKVRRYRSRNSNEIWPSSEESPIFNTPESNKSPVQPLGQNTTLLAASGLRIAAGELDRLTNQSRSAKSSLEIARISSGTESARSESESSVADTTPAVPTNSPSSWLSPMGLANPAPKPPQRPGLRGRRQHSRLSEVTTPEEINSSTQISGSSAISPQVQCFPSELVQNTLPGFEAEGCETSMSPPLSIRLPTSRGRLNDEPSPASVSAATQFPLDHNDSSEVAVGPGLILPKRTFSRRQILEPRSDETNLSDEGDIEEYILDQGPSRSEPNYHRTLSIGIRRTGTAAQESTLLPDVMGRLNPVKSHTAPKEFTSKSCHPNAWSPNQGEPGDSEPFCPSECVYSDRCGHESEP
ncbi:hypothetical protein F4824DRAFT_44241 [Ustulina deusta]|nr:hypothetical protein F4824DRAFT_44241 [Ustulina deusta]